MNVFQAIEARREITKYLDEPIPADTLKKVADAGFFAPSGNNLPSKNLIVVQNRESLDRLAETTPYMKWLKEAPAAIVVSGKPKASKYWLQDASIASAFIWLEAVEVGLGAAFGAVYHSEDEQESIDRENHVRNLLDIPGEYRIVAVLGLGYPEETPNPKKHLPREDVVHNEKFNGEG
ncbi:nitroreductase [Virgibacillus indicus]|uniref:Nitroreductase n=1 Tax=Virgibacillus indicus TaxID=2024554 RepID=A0A265N542_9BACI|nr:nitroreductase family protein [Virgibacillus indicus]OZU87153.1 nitroreductase [Virgibacillus indicus]